MIIAKRKALSLPAKPCYAWQTGVKGKEIINYFCSSLSRTTLLLPFYFLVFTFIFLTAYPLTLTPTLAQESSPSADIKSKLEALKQEIASKAAKYKQEITQKLQNKAYIGTIKTISEQSINLESSSGAKLVNINQDTIYDSKVKKKYSFKEAAEDDYIAALGDVDDTNTLTAKKIIQLPQPSKTPKTIIWGQVLELSDEIIIKTKDDKKMTVVEDDTTYQKGENEINFENIRINDSIIVVGTLNKSGSLSSKFIYVMSPGVVIKSKNISTPSGETATKSAVK